MDSQDKGKDTEAGQGSLLYRQLRAAPRTAEGHLRIGDFAVEGELPPPPAGPNTRYLELPARHRATGEPATLYVLEPEPGSETSPLAGELARFTGEAVLRLQSTRDGLGRLLDYGELGNLLWAASPADPTWSGVDWLEAPGLAGRLPDRAERVRALDAVEVALEGLGALHNEGLVYRVLRPRAIRRDPEWDLFLDFAGLSVPEGTRRSADGDVVAGPRDLHRVGYLAPEASSPWGVHDRRADVASAGALLHAALVGSHPYDCARCRRPACDEPPRQGLLGWIIGLGLSLVLGSKGAALPRSEVEEAPWALSAEQRAFRERERRALRNLAWRHRHPIHEHDPRLPGPLVEVVERALHEDPARRPADAWDLLAALREARSAAGL